jgi:hypothetical protein
MTTVLVGVLVLSVDAARLYNAQTERSNAADAAAVAAATQLDGEVGACARAIDAAINAQLANQETFASNRTGPDVYISPVGGTAAGGDPTANTNIRFLSELIKDNDGNVTGTYINNAAQCDADATFVEITTDLAAPGQAVQVDYYFAGIVGALTQAFPRGYAIAEYSIGYCNVPPMMMCALDNAPNLPGTYTDFMEAVEDYALSGYGLLLKSGTNSTQWGSGNFGFLRLGGVSGAKELGELIGQVGGAQECVGSGIVETEPGNNSGARWAFNTRFDMFHGAMSGNVGEAAWQPAANTVKGLVRDGGSCGWGGGGYGDPPNKYNGSASPLPEAMPFPMDRCAYGGTCDAVDNLGRLGNGDWDRQTYFDVNHEPPASLEGVDYDPHVGINGLLPTGLNIPSTGAGPCATFHGFEDADYDFDPDTGMNPSALHPDCAMSRYEDYLWELDRPFHSTNYSSVGPNSHLVDNTQGAAGPNPIPQPGEHAGENPGNGPQCSTAALGNYDDVTMIQDRRVVTAMVINCDPDNGGIEIKGKTEIPIDDPNVLLGTVDLFVLEPWQVNGGEHQISTEIIGPGGSAGLDDLEIVKEWVNLKESRQARQAQP